MLPIEVANHVHTLLATGILAALAVKDILHRTIPNHWWIWMALALTPSRLAVAILDPTPWLPTLAWSSGLMVLAFLFWMAGAWGGADAKGAMLLAWLLPMIDIAGGLVHALAWPMIGGLLVTLIWVSLTKKPVPFYAILSPAVIAVLWVLW